MRKACKICGGETRLIPHPKIAEYYQCLECEFVCKNEKDKVSPEAELKIYNRHNNSIEDPRYVEFFNKFLEDAVFPYVNEGKNGFDFGSGPEPVLAELLRRYHGYDMDIYDLFYSPEKVYAEKKYDLITTTEVVEHLDDPLHYVELLKSLLKPDGILAVMTLFHHMDDDYFRGWHYIRDWSHISFYTPKTMEVIAKKTGLKVIHNDGVRYTTFAIDN